MVEELKRKYVKNLDAKKTEQEVTYSLISKD